jgi:hypothetical protein
MGGKRLRKRPNNNNNPQSDYWSVVLICRRKKQQPASIRATGFGFLGEKETFWKEAKKNRTKYTKIGDINLGRER